MIKLKHTKLSLSLLPKAPSQALVIGGSARSILSALIGGPFMDDRASDLDLLYVGQDIIEESEYDSSCVESLGEFMESRDFTINQVAVDEQYVYTTWECLRDTVNGILRPLEARDRTFYRGVRFAARYGAKLVGYTATYSEPTLAFEEILQASKAYDSGCLDRFLGLLGIKQAHYRHLVLTSVGGDFSIRDWAEAQS